MTIYFLCVNLSNKDYIVDVGFGDNFLEPLVFELDVVQKDLKGLFKIIESNNHSFILKKYSEDLNEYKTEYEFKLIERTIDDFQDRINYFVLSNESIFRKNLFCSLEKESGRMSLKHDKLIVTQDSSKKEESITTKQEYMEILEKEFSIHLSLIEKQSISQILKAQNN